MTQAPFDPDQVASINAFQKAGVMHSFTCGTDLCGASLVAEERGLKCPKCEYTQDWVHAFMADWSWKPPEGSLQWLVMKNNLETEPNPE